MKDKKLNVGQVVFVLQSSEMKIIPAQVTEEIKRKKIDGESVQYYIRFSPDSKAKTFLLDFSKVMVFDSVNEAMDFLMSNARTSIEEICNAASVGASIFSDGNAIEEIIEKKSQVPVQETMKVLMDNGVVANVRI